MDDHRLPLLKKVWPRKNKYQEGQTISNIQDLLCELGHRHYVYLNGVVKHPTILLNMSLFTLLKFVSGGHLVKAIKVPQEN